MYCKDDGPSITEVMRIQPFHHKLWENLCSEVGQCNCTAAKKPPFLPFIDTNTFFAIQMIKLPEKQLNTN